MVEAFGVIPWTRLVAKRNFDNVFDDIVIRIPGTMGRFVTVYLDGIVFYNVTFIRRIYGAYLSCLLRVVVRQSLLVDSDGVSNQVSEITLPSQRRLAHFLDGWSCKYHRGWLLVRHLWPQQGTLFGGGPCT